VACLAVSQQLAQVKIHLHNKRAFLGDLNQKQRHHLQAVSLVRANQRLLQDQVGDYLEANQVLVVAFLDNLPAKPRELHWLKEVCLEPNQRLRQLSLEAFLDNSLRQDKLIVNLVERNSQTRLVLILVATRQLESLPYNLVISKEHLVWMEAPVWVLFKHRQWPTPFQF